MIQDALLIIHIVCGAVGLVVAALALFAPKRRGWHTRLGRIYLLAVAGIVSTTLGLFLYAPTELLGLGIIGIATGICAGLGFWMVRARPMLRGGTWFTWHLNLMSSSYISFVTAFLVQMTDGHLLAWLLPTIIGSPLIALRTARAVTGSRSSVRKQPSY
jgi:hypothetical protein